LTPIRPNPYSARAFDGAAPQRESAPAVCGLKHNVDPSVIIQKIAIHALPLIFAVTMHEAAHGYVADRMGDPTARMLGRLTLNPLPHVDPIGTVLVPLILILSGGTMFGWAKPVPITTSNFKNPDRGMAICAVAGPITNCVLALASGIALRIVLSVLGGATSPILVKILTPLALMLNASILWNIFLAAFNMIPLPPLDGGRVVAGLLPPRLSYSFSRIEPYGFIILMVLIFTGITRYIVLPPVMLLVGLVQFITGVSVV